MDKLTTKVVVDYEEFSKMDKDEQILKMNEMQVLALQKLGVEIAQAFCELSIIGITKDGKEVTTVKDEEIERVELIATFDINKLK